MWIPRGEVEAGQRPRAGTCAERPIRSLVKALSWRLTGSVDTLLLSWLFTGDLAVAAAIGTTEVLTKTVLYYLHERAWNRLSLGRGGAAGAQGEGSPGGEVLPAPGLRAVAESE